MYELVGELDEFLGSDALVLGLVLRVKTGHDLRRGKGRLFLKVLPIHRIASAGLFDIHAHIAFQESDKSNDK